MEVELAHHLRTVEEPVDLLKALERRGRERSAVAEAFLFGVSTLLISLILTFATYLAWEDWRQPGNNAQDDMSAFMPRRVDFPTCSPGLRRSLASAR
jgi:hypothetical protein